MGRYTYNASLVTKAVDELNNAINSLSSITSEIQAGINTINSATGAQYIDVDYSDMLKLKDAAEDAIEEDIRTINSKVQMIEDYEEAPFLKKIFASAGMALTKFTEGIASGIEDLGDGVVSLAGFVGGIFSSEFKEACGEYIKKDHVGDWFSEQYTTGGLSALDKYSYFGKDSAAANIFKGFGVAAPYIALSMTGVGLGVEVAAAGLSGLGSGTEAGLQKGMSYNRAFASGLWQGTKNAALVYGMSKISQGIQASAAGKTGQIVKGSADDFAKLTTGTADEVASTAKNMFNSADDLVATKLVDNAGNLTGYRLNSASSLQVVGDVTIDGTNAVVRSFGNAGTKEATRILASSGDELVYNVIKNTDDIVGKTFDDLVKLNGTGVGTADKVFTKAGEIGSKSKVLTASDDFVSSVGTKIGKTKVGTTLKNIGAKVANNNVVKKVSGAVTNTVAKHPVASFATAATVFTVDQIDEQAVGSNYRTAQLDPVIPTPTITPNPTATIPVTTAVVTTMPQTSTPVPTHTSTSTSNPNPTHTTTSGPMPTQTSTSGPGPTQTSTSGPVPTQTSTPAPTQTSTPTQTTAPTPTTEPTPTQTTVPTNKPSPNPTPPTPTSPNPYSPPIDQGGGEYDDTGFTGEETIPNEEVVEDSMSGSLTDIMSGNEYTRIPTSSTPITTTTTTTAGTKKSIIPVIAGLSAAAVAGIGTKAYLDKSENKESEEFEAEEWEEDSLDIDYNEAMEEDGDYLNPSDEYAYQEEGESEPGSYEAVNSSELASMQ